MTSELEALGEELDELREQGLQRTLRVGSHVGPRMQVDGREVTSFCSNDYLGLASDPRLVYALAEGAREEGAGAGAARLVSGTRPSHRALEEAVAEFKGTEAALVFGSGYLANISVLPALVGERDLIVSDALNHASLVDGCRLSRAEVAVVPHRDVEAIDHVLRCPGYRRRLVVVEGLYSMEGDLAPLPELLDCVKEHGAFLVIDDAHGNGTLGPHGRGIADYFEVTVNEPVIQVGTFGKAFGGYGAFVAWHRTGIDFLLNRARAFLYSTALPPGVARMNMEGLRLVQEEPRLRHRLWENIYRLRANLAPFCSSLPPWESPILSLVIGDAARASQASRELFEAGFWIPAIRPPTVPRGTSRLRVTLSGLHSTEQVDALSKTLLRLLPQDALAASGR